MNRRFALVALWAVFAAASVGVGFGAAGLVGSTPFTYAASDIRDSADISRDFVATAPTGATSKSVATPGADKGAASKGSPSKGSPSSGSPSTSSKSAAPRRSASSQATSAPGSGRAGTKFSTPSKSTTRSSPAQASSRPKASAGGGVAAPTETRGSVDTQGGFVSAGCLSGLVSLGASPAVGWALDGVTPGRAAEGKAEFEQSDENDARVKVRAWCEDGEPKFSVENIAGGAGGAGGGGGDGGGENSGSAGGGGDGG